MFSTPQVNVYAADVARTVAFYASLGFAETFRTPRDGDPIHVELHLEGLTLGVAAAASARRDHGIDVTPGRSMEVVVWCDDVDTAYAGLLAGGAPSVSAPHDWLDSLRVAWVSDPEGNPVELVQRRA